MEMFFVMRSSTKWDGPDPVLVAGPMAKDLAAIARDRLNEAEGRSTDGATLQWRYSLVGAMK